MEHSVRADPPLRVRARAGVIGDIHADHERLSWAVSVLASQKVELVLATGDIADGPRQAEGVAEACQVLQRAGAFTVLGNHDRWLLDSQMRDYPNATFLDELDASSLEYLRNLPATREVATPGGLLLLCHGVGPDDMATLYPYDRGPDLTGNAALQRLLREGRYRYVVGGHTHRRMVRRIEDTTFINAGAIEETREPCCLVLDFEGGTAQYFDWASGHTVTGPQFPL